MTKLKTIEIVTAGWEATFRTGQSIANFLYPGDVLALFGDLGSGKTVFTKGVCKGLGVTDVVTSPTFTLVQEYSGRMPVYHFDFYRLTALHDIEMLDLDYYFNAGGISIIEWAERGEQLLPFSIFRIELDCYSENTGDFEKRRLRITAPSDRILDQVSS
ncbi:tRNA (adenosine(37)-N6)-threonylcarbamoyltransferase complex ATPase subunit type 1 TsaE [bacterium]|nr:tRNA (adenosine(37)-N6)-threonylcarbamoyltransferase complex ATPase subunit type 1 TsaE [bacterium]